MPEICDHRPQPPFLPCLSIASYSCQSISYIPHVQCNSFRIMPSQVDMLQNRLPTRSKRTVPGVRRIAIPDSALHIRRYRISRQIYFKGQYSAKDAADEVGKRPVPGHESCTTTRNSPLPDTTATYAILAILDSHLFTVAKALVAFCTFSYNSSKFTSKVILLKPPADEVGKRPFRGLDSLPIQMHVSYTMFLKFAINGHGCHSCYS